MVEKLIKKESNFLQHYRFQHYLVRLGKRALSLINSITLLDRRQNLGVHVNFTRLDFVYFDSEQKITVFYICVFDYQKFLVRNFLIHSKINSEKVDIVHKLSHVLWQFGTLNHQLSYHVIRYIFYILSSSLYFDIY